MKKLLAVLLSLCLVVGMLPVMAFADGGEMSEDGFKTAVSSGGTVTLTNDIVLTDDLEISNDVTISGTYTISGDVTITITDGKKVTFDGCTVDRQTDIILEGTAAASGLTSYVIATKHDSNGNTTVYYTDDYTKLGSVLVFDGYTSDVYQSVEAAITGNINNATVSVIAPLNESFTVPNGTSVAINANVEVTGNIVVENGAILTNAGVINGNVSGEGKFENQGAGTVNGTTPGEETEEPNPPVEEPDPEPVYYTVKFDVKPYWANVVVTDSAGNAVNPDRNGQYWLEADKNYTYKVSAYGFGAVTGNIDLADAGDTIEVTLTQSERVVVWPTSHGDVSFSYLSHGWVAVYVDPNNGYYLDDLTIYRVGYGAIDYGKWDNGVYYFRMRDGQQYIIDADFASAPSEYRVYVDSSILHGDVSVDTVYAEEGEWVYITVDPDVGYRLYNLTVTRPSGNTVKVEHVRDNVYRFSMPGVRVTVDAEFIRTVTPFTDVRLADWFYEYVSFAYRYGLMEGINSYQFAPDATATRAMVVQILYRMSGEPAVSYGSGFTDVASNAWYADAIAWAARNNIVNGTGAATFDPNAPVTREQFATMLYRYARYRGFNTSLTANILSYYDVNQVSEYAFEALQWACAEGIVNGTSTGYLTPQGNATRAQLAAMLMRFCNEYFDL